MNNIQKKLKKITESRQHQKIIYKKSNEGTLSIFMDELSEK